MMKFKYLASLLLGLALPLFAAGEERIRVVASTMDMGDLIKQIGGDRVDVYSVSKGQYDLHFFEPRPSEVVKLKRADMVVVSGMELDAFMPPMIDASRNKDIKYGRKGFVDPSRGVNALDVPQEKISGKMGDVHPHGNPHFWFTPDNISVACSNITAGLIRVDPEYKDHYTSRNETYIKKVHEKYAELKKLMAPYKGTKVVQYHASWDYFCEEFGLDLRTSIEPKPGLAPSASHLRKLVKAIKEEDIKIALVEPYYSERPLKFLRKNTKIKTLRLPLHLGGIKERKSYLSNLEYIVTKIVGALANDG